MAGLRRVLLVSRIELLVLVAIVLDMAVKPGLDGGRRYGAVMAIAQFKDLVLDAADATRLGAFWGQVLDRKWQAQDNGDGWLSGATPQHTIWINNVPEPLTVKNRVHFDIYATSRACQGDQSRVHLARSFGQGVGSPRGWACRALRGDRGGEGQRRDRLNVSAARRAEICAWCNRVETPTAARRRHLADALPSIDFYGGPRPSALPPNATNGRLDRLGHPIIPPG